MRDPILLEIVKNALITIAEETGVVVARSAYSPGSVETADTSIAIFDRSGRLIAQSTGTPLTHLSSLRYSPKELMKDFPPETMEDGDVFIFNDPFHGGIHPTDVMIFRPVFYKGKLSFFCGTLMFVADMGGMSSGGLPANATECYHEGLILPPVKLYEGGRLNENLVRVIRANSRTPNMLMGDIQAIVAGTSIGGKRVLELVDKYGYEALSSLIAANLDYTEALTRAGLAKIPDGVYHGSYMIEEDGIEPGKTFNVKATITIKGSDCLVDFSGTDKQARGAINASYTQALTGAVFALRCYLDPTIPMNEGFYRPFEFVQPLGTLVNPSYPAACNMRMATVQAMIDAIHEALAPAFPEKAVAAAANCHVYTAGGKQPDSGDIWSMVDAHMGPIGARSNKDGVDAMPHPIYNAYAYGRDIEVLEAKFPVVFDYFRMWTDSAGPGRWRGGVGLIKQVKFLVDADLTLRAIDRSHIPPQGVRGGKAARVGGFILNRGTPDETALPTKKTNHHIRAGDVLTVLMPGGGGFGDPFGRDPDLVVRDVKLGLVSREAAAHEYGVMVDLANGDVDRTATSRLREK